MRKLVASQAASAVGVSASAGAAAEAIITLAAANSAERRNIGFLPQPRKGNGVKVTSPAEARRDHRHAGDNVRAPRFYPARGTNLTRPSRDCAANTGLIMAAPDAPPHQR